MHGIDHRFISKWDLLSMVWCTICPHAVKVDFAKFDEPCYLRAGYTKRCHCELDHHWCFCSELIAVLLYHPLEGLLATAVVPAKGYTAPAVRYTVPTTSIVARPQSPKLGGHAAPQIKNVLMKVAVPGVIHTIQGRYFLWSKAEETTGAGQSHPRRGLHTLPTT